MKFRKLRIAWSVLCGIACVLLILLWVRSYWRIDMVSVPILSEHGLWLTSESGRLMFGCGGGDPEDVVTEWSFDCFTFDDRDGPGQFARFLGPVFAFYFEEDGTYIHVPHWFPALIAGSMAFILARPRRYTMRTLLIITTLIAIGLGLIAYYATHATGGGRGRYGGAGLAESGAAGWPRYE